MADSFLRGGGLPQSTDSTTRGGGTRLGSYEQMLKAEVKPCWKIVVATKNTTVETFRPFPKLPIEIRRGIWYLIIPKPRVIRVFSTWELARRHQARKLGSGSTTLSTKVPVLLSINKEAREFAREHYSLGFEEQLLGRPVYIDFKRDTVQFDDDSNLMAFCCIDAKAFNFDTRIKMGHHPNLLKLMPTKTTSAEKEIQHLAIEQAFLKDLIIALPRFDKLESVLLPRPDDDPIHRRLSPRTAAWAEQRFIEDRKAMEEGLSAKWDSMAKQKGDAFKRPSLEYLPPKEMRQRLGIALGVRGL